MEKNHLSLSIYIYIIDSLDEKNLLFFCFKNNVIESHISNFIIASANSKTKKKELN